MPQPGGASAPAGSPPPVTFEQAIAAAVDQNLTVQITATNVLRAEALLQQVRATTLPFANASAVTSTIDAARGFDGNVVQPQNQWTLAASVGMPVLAAARWAARARAGGPRRDRRLNTTDVQPARHADPSAATAYLAVITRSAWSKSRNGRSKTARAQVDYNQKRLEGGIGSRLNALRASQSRSPRRGWSRCSA